MSSYRDEITHDMVRELFVYKPKTGELIWRPRKAKWFDGDQHRRAVWNARWAGRVAGSVSAYGYLVTSILGMRIPAHCVIWMWMTGNWPVGEIDHADHDRMNNRWKNLADVPFAGNRKNKRVYSNNKSGVMGVSWNEKANRWRASIGVNGAMVRLGTFQHRADAIAARRAAEVQYGFHPNHNVSA